MPVAMNYFVGHRGRIPCVDIGHQLSESKYTTNVFQQQQQKKQQKTTQLSFL